ADRALDGADVTPLFEGKPVKRPHPLYWQYDFAISKPWVVSLRDGPWKLLADAALERFELYDLSDDTGEKKDLAGKEPARVRQRAAEMKRLHAEVLAEGERSGNPPPRRATNVSVDGAKFLINGKPTYAGRKWNGRPIEGLLFNSRMVQAIFDDRNAET